MKQAQIRSIMHRRFVPCTTDSRHDQPIAANVLDRQFDAKLPNQKWCCDITYIQTEEGVLYLATVMDLCSRKIVGWSMADHLRTELCLDALDMALRSGKPDKSLIHHSDRGVQYASNDYARVLQQHEVLVSMSRKGNCYDNATMESFWGTLKTELVHHVEYNTHAQAVISDLQVHRVLVQSPETSLRDRLSKPRTVRGQPELTHHPPRPPFVGQVRNATIFRIRCALASLREI